MHRSLYVTQSRLKAVAHVQQNKIRQTKTTDDRRRLRVILVYRSSRQTWNNTAIKQIKNNLLCFNTVLLQYMRTTAIKCKFSAIL